MFIHFLCSSLDVSMYFFFFRESGSKWKQTSVDPTSVYYAPVICQLLVLENDGYSSVAQPPSDSEVSGSDSNRSACPHYRMCGAVMLWLVSVPRMCYHCRSNKLFFCFLFFFFNLQDTRILISSW